MYEGAFRILRALGDGRSRSQDEIVHAAGEASSVVREVIERYPKWFEDDERRVLEDLVNVYLRLGNEERAAHFSGELEAHSEASAERR